MGNHNWNPDWQLLVGSILLYLAAVGIPILAIFILFVIIF